jgi:RNA polymerase sigma-70 factor, ECF subfamily
MVLLQGELRAIAERQLAHERIEHTLQPTALVNEAYLRLREQRNLAGKDRTAFLAAAAQTIRRILVDYARAKAAGKRGGGGKRISLTSFQGQADDPQTDVLALDAALRKLQLKDDRIYQVVLLRYFSELRQEEIAQALGVSVRTVAGDWHFAKAWLRRELVT